MRFCMIISSQILLRIVFWLRMHYMLFLFFIKEHENIFFLNKKRKNNVILLLQFWVKIINFLLIFNRCRYSRVPWRSMETEMRADILPWREPGTETGIFWRTGWGAGKLASLIPWPVDIPVQYVFFIVHLNIFYMITLISMTKYIVLCAYINTTHMFH
jgi:hypothetical protein